MKEINLEEILSNATRCTIEEDVDLDNIENFYFKYEDVISIIKEVCSQTLELAAENAKVMEVCAEHDDYLIHNIRKQSILDTINQIK